MMRTVILALLIGVSTLTARAANQTLLIELEPRTRLFPGSVSATGAVVADTLDRGGGFYWMPTTGVISTGARQSTAVSRDGRTIAGSETDSRRTSRHLATGR